MTDRTQLSAESCYLKPCPFCGSARVEYIGAPGNGYRVECKGCLAQSPWGDYGIQVNTAWNARATGDAQRPKVSIEPMHLSDDRMDYFVAIKVGDRVVTPHVFREEYKAAYHVALYDWLLNGAGEEPDCVEFGPDDWPARIMPAVAQSVGMRDALEDIATIGRKITDPKNTYGLQMTNIAQRALASQPSPAATVETKRTPLDLSTTELNQLATDAFKAAALSHSSAVTAEAIRIATLWFEQQIENAQQDQISGFAAGGGNIRGERAHARHCAVYEAQQVFLEAVRTISEPQAAPEMAAYRELEEVARHLPRATPAAGGAGTVHQFPIEAAWVWANDRALKNLGKARASSQVTRPQSESGK